MKSLRHKCLSKALGYSLLEMMMTLAIGMILVRVAVTTMFGDIQGYRLNSVAQQVANLAGLTGFTGIRRNSVIRLRQVVQTGNTILFVDVDGDGKLGPTEPLVMLPSDMQLANGQSLTPPAASIGQPTQDFAGQIIFDYRGTVYYTGGGPMTAYFLALGYKNSAQYVCRAITVALMGQTNTWKAPAGGTCDGM